MSAPILTVKVCAVNIASSSPSKEAHPKLAHVRRTHEVHHEARHAAIKSVSFQWPWPQFIPHEGLLALVDLSFDHLGGCLELRYVIEWRGCWSVVRLMKRVAKRLERRVFACERREGELVSAKLNPH